MIRCANICLNANCEESSDANGEAESSDANGKAESSEPSNQWALSELHV